MIMLELIMIVCGYLLLTLYTYTLCYFIFAIPRKWNNRETR